MAVSKIKLKLLIDTKGDKLLFAEVGKDFVDFLFYLLSLPVGTVVKLLKEKSLVGCLGKIYESLENLGETYMQPDQDKNSVLNPKSSICAPEIPLLLSQNESNTRKCDTCGIFCGHYTFSDSPNVRCPQCNNSLRREMSYISAGGAKTEAGGAEGGFVKGVVTYTVMDNVLLQDLYVGALVESGCIETWEQMLQATCVQDFRS